MTLKTPWPICDTCQKIPIAKFRRGAISEPYHLWRSFSTFADSASRGCHTCTLLLEAVREPFKSRLSTEPVYLEHAVVSDSFPHAVALTIDPASLQRRETWDESLWRRGDDQTLNFQFASIADVKYVDNAEDVPQSARHFRGKGDLAPQSNHEALSADWSASQRSNQPREGPINVVHNTNGLTTPPTRLIYVGSGVAQDPPRLFAGQKCLKHGYIVLSHCWGNTPKIAAWQLTTKTVEEFATAVPLDVLPQTLYDAIVWTRELGERFIWIDSMCILQDSAEDWQREASRMASIYGSAILTLVAASSSVYGGMTDRRNPLRNTAAGLDLQDGSSTGTVYILPNGQPRNSTPASPTDSRGWCYQENLLSSRLAKMTQKHVLWQCVGDGTRPATRAQGLEQLGGHPSHYWYTLWYQFVERYSNMSLTYPKDKLLAFHGIACDKVGRAYIGGFLKTDPWASLLWCRDENQILRRPGSRYNVYVGPTWSWASIDVPVLFYEARGRQARKTQFEPASLFDTGAVRGGTIELSAYVAMTRTSGVRPLLFTSGPGPHTHGRRNCIDPITGELIGLIVFDVATEARDDMVVCCMLLYTAHIGLWEMDGTAGLGLALTVHEDTAENLKGQRVGYVQLTSAFGGLCHKRRLVLS